MCVTVTVLQCIAGASDALSNCPAGTVAQAAQICIQDPLMSDLNDPVVLAQSWSSGFIGTLGIWLVAKFISPILYLAQKG